MDSEEGCQKDKAGCRSVSNLGWEMEDGVWPDQCEGSNIRGNYILIVRTIRSVGKQKDLGMQAHSSLKMATHVDRIVKNMDSMLSFIHQGIDNTVHRLAIML